MRASELQRSLAVSQPTLSRLVRAAGPDVTRIGRARRSGYAASREIRGLGRAWAAYRVRSEGRIDQVATLHALAPRGWWWQTPAPPEWLGGDVAPGVFPDLPWFFEDLRPQGFLGRAFARRHAAALGLGQDPQQWSADEVLVALLALGDDLPGDLVIGDRAVAALQRARLSDAAAVPDAERPARYESLAVAALAGDVAGSSAGGEQPKFATVCRAADGSVRHVLVKFSPPVDTAAGQRWADLLRCEHLATEVLRDHGIAACHTAWCAGSERVFLEVTRFDRLGEHGRRGVVSLLAVAMATGATLDSWAAAADWLERDRWLTAQDADTLRVLWWFGRLIANADQHFANVSLLLEDRRPLALAPVYDMLPMHFRPTAAGEIADRRFDIDVAPPRLHAAWATAAAMAGAYWMRVRDDPHVSTPFRATAAACGELVHHAVQRLRVT
ncbi:type II toxin-antitoxin system HipA family toxin YjjJ [bacterium]|nr:type II toxin-antitoxin system HipA family toxin YjjJ [bacterium]